MTQAPVQSKHAVTRAKLALVGLLAVVLVAVIGYQLRGRKPAPLVPRAEANQRQFAADSSAARTSDATPRGPARVAPAQRRPRNKWPDIPLSEVIAHDPFTLPPALLAIASESDTAKPGPSSKAEPADQSHRQELERRRADVLAAMRKKGVSMVLTSPGGTVATVGSLRLKVGDVVEGLRVAEIGPSGVVLIEENTP
jgi:hypothetical protein